MGSRRGQKELWLIGGSEGVVDDVEAGGSGMDLLHIRSSIYEYSCVQLLIVMLHLRSSSV